MANFHEILFKIGRILDVSTMDENSRFQIICKIKVLVSLQLDGGLTIKEGNLVNKIVSDYNDFRKSNFNDFNSFKYSTYSNMDSFLKGNTFNELIHRIYGILRNSDVNGNQEELRESFNELISINNLEEETEIDLELKTLLIWKYRRFGHQKFSSQLDFKKDSTELIEKYFVRRANGILTLMSENRE